VFFFTYVPFEAYLRSPSSFPRWDMNLKFVEQRELHFLSWGPKKFFFSGHSFPIKQTGEVEISERIFLKFAFTAGALAQNGSVSEIFFFLRRVSLLQLFMGLASKSFHLVWNSRCKLLKQTHSCCFCWHSSFSVAFLGLFYSKKSHLWEQKSHKKSLRDNILSSKTKQKNSPFHFDLIHALLFCVFVSSWDHFQTTMMSASRRTRF